MWALFPGAGGIGECGLEIVGSGGSVFGKGRGVAVPGPAADKPPLHPCRLPHSELSLYFPANHMGPLKSVPYPEGRVLCAAHTGWT